MMKASASDEALGNKALDLANTFLADLQKRKVESSVAYAALGCAFQAVHRALGKDKKEWLELTKEMAELIDWEKE